MSAWRRLACRLMVSGALLIGWAGLSPAAWSAPVIAGIAIEGLERTSERVVRRELPFAAGDVWRSGMKALAQRRLLNLGLFSEVEVRPPDARGMVRIMVRERWSLWLLPQATRKDNGASSLGLALDEYNLWGLAHRLHLAWRKDTGRNFTGSGGIFHEFGYDWNRMADSRWSLRVRADWGEAAAEAWRAGAKVADYLRRKHFVSLELVRAFGAVPGEGWSAGAGIAASRTSWRLIRGAPQPGYEETRGRTLFGEVGFRNLADHVDWIEGERLDGSLNVTSRAWGATSSHARWRFSWARHAPVDERGDTWNVRVEGGAIMGDARAAGLFDLGNRNGLRGYYPGELQASRWLSGSLEGRWLFPDARNLQGVAFIDTGWLGGVVEAVGGRHWHAGAGAGMRWTLRWLVHGTLRLDLAWGLQSRRWRVYLGTGQAF